MKLRKSHATVRKAAHIPSGFNRANTGHGVSEPKQPFLSLQEDVLENISNGSYSMKMHKKQIVFCVFFITQVKLEKLEYHAKVHLFQ